MNRENLKFVAVWVALLVSTLVMWILLIERCNASELYISFPRIPKTVLSPPGMYEVTYLARVSTSGEIVAEWYKVKPWLDEMDCTWTLAPMTITPKPTFWWRVKERLW